MTSATSFREFGHQLIDQLADHLEAVHRRELPVNRWTPPEAMYDFWKTQLDHPTDASTFVDRVLEQSIQVHHPAYVGHQVSAPVPETALMSLLSALLNNGGAIYEMGAVSTAMERILCERMAAQCGLPDTAGGFLTSGGTLANLTALLCARRHHSPADVWQRGHDQPLAILVNEQAHYCVDRAARIMGFGAAGVRKVPATANFSMNTDALPAIYAQTRSEGYHVVAVVGSACTTATGSYDDLSAIADFCGAHGLWFHVDGAHGGAAVFSQKYRPLVRGIERANSIVVDGHKMMGAPALTTFLLFRDEQDSFRTFAQDAQYLWEANERPEWYNLGKRTLECTKLMMSLRLFYLWQQRGPSFFEQHLNRLYDLGQSFARLVQSHSAFELALPPQTNIVCFRYATPVLTEEKLSDLNAQIRQTMLERGSYYLVQTDLYGTRWLRVTLMNERTTVADLEKLLEELDGVARSLLVAEAKP